MAVWNKNTMYWVTGLVLAFMVALAFLNGCKREQPEPEGAAPTADAAPSADVPRDPLAAAKGLFGESNTNLQKAVDEAKTWGPTFDPWRGKIAPDFTLTDIDGNVHTLSSYRGRNVLVVFWATWVGASKLEVLELVELRKSVAQDKLAILALSREDPTLLKNYAGKNGLNYPVLSIAGAALPSPYADVQDVPSAFFIDPEGRIKLATTGMLPRSDINKILDAS